MRKRQLDREQYDRIYLGITGGTNPLIAASFQAAMSLPSAEVIPIYVQGRGSQSLNIFCAADIRLDVLAEEVLRTAQSGQVRVAAALAQRLPKTPHFKFLRQTISAFADWDDFNYSDACQHFVQQAPKCDDFGPESLLYPLAHTVKRFASFAKPLSSFAAKLIDPLKFVSEAQLSTWSDEVSSKGRMLVSDALANAQRRFDEGRYTDAVLRAYRASESATQIRLFTYGIFPSKPDASVPSAQVHLRHLSTRNDGSLSSLAFHASIQLLEQIESFSLPESIRKEIRSLQELRNYSFLEHGYDRITKSKAQDCLQYSLHVCTYILETQIDADLHNFKMNFC